MEQLKKKAAEGEESRRGKPSCLPPALSVAAHLQSGAENPKQRASEKSAAAEGSSPESFWLRFAPGLCGRNPAAVGKRPVVARGQLLRKSFLL